MANFKLLPCLPVGLACAWVTHLRAVTENPPSSINLTEFSLKLSVLKAHLSIRERKVKNWKGRGGREEGKGREREREKFRDTIDLK